VFAVLVALIVFTAAVICILYALIRALRMEEQREETHVINMIQNSAPLEICPRSSVHSVQSEAKSDRVVLEMDKEQTGETQTQSSFTRVITDTRSPSATSPQSTKTMPSPADEDSSTLDVEFEKKSVTEYERKLAENECLMNRLREQLAEQSKNGRKVWFDDEPEVFMTGMPPSPEAVTPQKQLSPVPEPIISPIFSSFIESKPLKPAKKKLDRGHLPPLKSFTPPRTLTPHHFSSSAPHISVPDQASLLMAPKKLKVPASRRTFKRPNSSIYKPVVHQFTFE